MLLSKSRFLAISVSFMYSNCTTYFTCSFLYAVNEAMMSYWSGSLLDHMVIFIIIIIIILHCWDQCWFYLLFFFICNNNIYIHQISVME